MSKFYRTVIEVEVLTNEPYVPGSLEEVQYDITEGHASGAWDITASEEVTKERMAALLEAQGSDPDFLIDPDEEEL